jgi:hypothetical protein
MPTVTAPFPPKAVIIMFIHNHVRIPLNHGLPFLGLLIVG